MRRISGEATFGLVLALVGIAGVGLPMVAPNHPEWGWVFIGIAVVGSILLAAHHIYHSWRVIREHGQRRKMVAFLGMIVSGVGFVGFAAAYVWPRSVPQVHETVGQKVSSVVPSPDVSLRFVFAKRPAVVLTNKSSAVARQIKYTVLLWNLDNPVKWSNLQEEDAHEALPIPIQTFDFIRPGKEGGPENLFDSSLVLPLIKDGDHLIGSASVECPDCLSARAYVVSIVLGQGGWFYELPQGVSETVLIPTHQTKENVIAYSKALNDLAPVEDRIVIPGAFSPVATNPPAAPPPSPKPPR